MSGEGRFATDNLRGSASAIDRVMPNLAIPSGPAERAIVFTVVLVAAALGASVVLRAVAATIFDVRHSAKPRFWSEQIIRLLVLATMIIGVWLLWADDVSNLGGVLGLAAAGVAVALQRVITSFAAYLIILRGKVFSVGDRITLGGVRGDVVALGFMQTAVLEMGQSPPEQASDPAVWVGGRQYTGRIVWVTNDKLFDSPVYNYTHEFPFVWDEITIPIHHDADRARAEEILLAAARNRTNDVVAEARPCIDQLRSAYYVKGEIQLEPRVYLTITDNWLELALRFLSREPGVRVLKDALYRDIMKEFEQAGIAIASSTSEVSIMTPLEVRDRAAG